MSDSDQVAPACRDCGKALKRRTNPTEISTATGTVNWGQKPPTEAVIVTREERANGTTMLYWWVPDMGYGKDGDNLFCNSRCGHRWAVKTIRQAQEPVEA